MQTIGTNSIRVYHVDANGDHRGCMEAFADAGIYVWLDLDTFDTYVEQVTPRWTKAQSDAFEKVMDEFQKYDNLAGFFVGNEAITTANGSVTAPYIKAAARDMKAYRDSKQYRPIPIGYSAADIATLRPMLQNYLACGDDARDAIDFFSLNAYSWCGKSSYEQSGYDVLKKNSTDLSIPIFMWVLPGCVLLVRSLALLTSGMTGRRLAAIPSDRATFRIRQRCLARWRMCGRAASSTNGLKRRTITDWSGTVKR